MTGEFRDYAVSTQDVSSSAGDPVPVLMPSDVVAGDHLFVIGGNADLNCLGFTTTVVSGHLVSYMTGATDWQLLCQAPYIMVKRADGSEGGTTVTFLSQNTTSFSGATRPNVHIAVCYRFPLEPTLQPTALFPDQIYTVYALKSFGGSTPVDSRTSGTYPGFMQTGIEARIVGFMGSGGHTGDLANTFVVDSGTWAGLDVQDRTGVHSLAGPMFSGPDTVAGTTVSVADVINLDGGTDLRNENGGIILDGPDTAGGFLHAIGLYFPVPIAAYWGINATTPF